MMFLVISIFIKQLLTEQSIVPGKSKSRRERILPANSLRLTSRKCLWYARICRICVKPSPMHVMDGQNIDISSFLKYFYDKRCVPYEWHKICDMFYGLKVTDVSFLESFTIVNAVSAHVIHMRFERMVIERDLKEITLVINWLFNPVEDAKVNFLHIVIQNFNFSFVVILSKLIKIYN